MKFDPAIHHRRSIRLNEYDYSQPGMYFITVCTLGRKNLLGEVVSKEVELSEIGKIVEKCWLDIPEHFPNVQLDRHVVMPNHLHGIVFLREYPEDLVGVRYIEPQRATKGNEFQHMTPKSIGSIVQAFKAAVTRICRRRDIAQVSWQRNYYEHIIRDGEELDRIREYISENPLNLTIDEEFPGNMRMDILHRGGRNELDGRD
jgi:putative transposase